jgi:hypothetical protein
MKTILTGATARDPTRTRTIGRCSMSAGLAVTRARGDSGRLRFANLPLRLLTKYGLKPVTVKDTDHYKGMRELESAQVCVGGDRGVKKRREAAASCAVGKAKREDVLLSYLRASLRLFWLSPAVCGSRQSFRCCH